MNKTLLFVFALYLFSAKNFAQVNLLDSTALVDLYNSTDGANWTDNSNWLTTAPLGTWKGVTVEDGRITVLYLSDNHLVGSIPSSFENLTALKDIAMSINQLTGTIPAGIGSFPDLRNLELSSNQLTGAIPSTLGNSTKLQWLLLAENQLTGEIPASLTKSKLYDTFELQYNQLSGKIPHGFGDVRTMVFNVGNNQLSGPLPDDFGNLLTYLLNIRHNQLSGDLPASFGVNFGELLMDHNQFTFEGIESLRATFPEKVWDYDVQKTLPITNNNPVLSVTAGGTLGNNTYTWYKDNGDAPYQAINADSTLTLAETGTYWAVINNSIATALTLYTDTITIADILTMLERDSLALVDLYNSTDGANWTNNSNWLTTAPLNTWYGVTVTNERVTDILLPFNNLNGTLPNSLGNLTGLVNLQLNNNQLQNEIPASLGSIVSLNIIILSHNQFSGELPDTWVQTNIEAFDFSHNQLSGPVPPSVCSVNGYFLFLNNNQFTFEGMECIASLDPDPNELNEVYYDTQKTLVITNNNNATLSVSAGGTLSNNTYTWYKDNGDAPYQVISGDSTIKLTQPGTYWVVVTNSIATGLTLNSETIEIASVLPLTWLNFTASNCSDNVCLQWQTAHEQHTAHFEIERSVDGKNFMQLSKIASQNIPARHTYSATDHSPAYGTNYYRIKQADLDGRYSYSDIISVSLKNAGKLTIRPNPANNFIMLSGIDKAERVILYNMSGQMLRQWQHVTANQQLYISDLQKGMYVIKVLHHNGEAIHKIIKQ